MKKAVVFMFLIFLPISVYALFDQTIMPQQLIVSGPYCRNGGNCNITNMTVENIEVTNTFYNYSQLNGALWKNISGTTYPTQLKTRLGDTRVNGNFSVYRGNTNLLMLRNDSSKLYALTINTNAEFPNKMIYQYIDKASNGRNLATNITVSTVAASDINYKETVGVQINLDSSPATDTRNLIGLKLTDSGAQEESNHYGAVCNLSNAVGRRDCLFIDYGDLTFLVGAVGTYNNFIRWVNGAGAERATMYYDESAAVGADTLVLSSDEDVTLDANTGSGDIFMNGNLGFNDNVKVMFGTGGVTSRDMSMYYTGGKFIMEKNVAFGNVLTDFVFNENSQDVNFRVESNGDTEMLYVDGGTNEVGISTTSPRRMLDVAGAFIANDYYTGSNRQGMTGNFSTVHCWQSFEDGLLFATNCTVIT